MNKILKWIGLYIMIISLMGVIFCACDNGFSNVNHTSHRHSENNLKPCLRKAIGGFRVDNQLDSLLLSRLMLVYDQRNDLIWSDSSVVNQSAFDVAQSLNHSYLSGLLPWFYPIPIRFQQNIIGNQSNSPSCDEMAKDDVTLSMSLLRYMVHLNMGIQRSVCMDDSRVNLIDSLIIPRFQNLDSFSNELMADLEPVSPFYNQMKSVLPDFSVFFDHFLLGDLKPTDEEKHSIWKIFYMTGFCKRSFYYSETEFLLALHSWQMENHLTVDDRFTYDTRKALADLGLSVFYKVSLNMDRIRQYPPELNDYLWVNIPEFSLFACQSDSIIQRWKVIVGKPKTPTPILTSAMSHVLTYPQWNIPPSIVVKEVLPDMRKDPLYLQKNGYVITDWKGGRLNPDQVSIFSYTLNNHPYNIMQPPGNDNALGILKFLFDNSETVYLHDTNSRSLFARNYRAMSHGCVRVHEPHRLAEYLLDDASLSIMDRQLSSRYSGYIKIKKPVGICIRYITCSTDSDGNVVLLPDLYNYDDIDLKVFLSGRNDHKDHQ